MKKKLFSLAVTLVMALSLAVPAMAADITIGNYAEGETYTAYKIFNYTQSGENYAYTMAANNSLKSVVEGFKVDETGALDLENGTQVFTTSAIPNDNSKLRVDVAEVFTADATDEAAAAAFAAYLSTRITDAGVSGVANTGNQITGLDAGYYFVDTTLGSLCSLFNADTSQTLVEKNSIPSLTKEVQEDSNTTWGETATAEYGQSVEFRLTVNTGTSNGNGTGVDADYEITDVIPSNMTLDNNADDGEPSYITLPAGWTKGTHYTESYDDESRTLTITLKQAKLATLDESYNIEITYSATLNDTAVVEVHEVNTATLVYKEQTSEDKASVVTYSIDGDSAAITKVDGEGEALAGVKFVLTNAEGKFAKLDTATWKLTGWVEAQEDATELVTDKNGKIYADGLDAGTYTLKETETLPGYNLLNDTITATIAENGDVTYKYTSSDDSANTINIVNESGAILPGTGGMGTTIFYVVGGTLVVAAAVLLITKKRMHNVED